MIINNKFDPEASVFLKTDVEKTPRVVVSITVGPNDNLTYHLRCGTENSHHAEFELQSILDTSTKGTIGFENSPFQ